MASAEKSRPYAAVGAAAVVAAGFSIAILLGQGAAGGQSAAAAVASVNLDNFVTLADCPSGLFTGTSAPLYVPGGGENTPEAVVSAFMASFRGNAAAIGADNLTPGEVSVDSSVSGEYRAVATNTRGRPIALVIARLEPDVQKWRLAGGIECAK